VGRATKAAGKGYATFVPHAEAAKALESHGFSAWFVASEHAWMLAGARAVLKGLGRG
jgi:2-keto-3-deoxy-L-rhamnonate aldolase RhmA